MNIKHLLTIASALTGLGLGSVQAQPIPEVDLVLFLSVDVSGSISTTEYALQRTGYANAFLNPSIYNLFEAPYEPITMAIAYGEWSQIAGTPSSWFIVDSAADAQAFGTYLSSWTRTTDIGTTTGIARGITAASNHINSGIGSSFTLASDARVVIDVSGDGKENVQNNAAVTTARNAALAGNVDSINGLAIVTPQVPDLATYYSTYVAGGGGFVLVADGFEDFQNGITRKIAAEIQDIEIPEPATIGLLGIAGILGFIFLKRRRQVSPQAVA